MVDLTFFADCAVIHRENHDKDNAVVIKLVSFNLRKFKVAFLVLRFARVNYPELWSCRRILIYVMRTR
jgi:hypothetical protein